MGIFDFNGDGETDFFEQSMAAAVFFSIFDGEHEDKYEEDENSGDDEDG